MKEIEATWHIGAGHFNTLLSVFFHWSDFEENRRNRRSVTCTFVWYLGKEKTEGKKVISKRPKFQNPGQIETNLTIGAPIQPC